MLLLTGGISEFEAHISETNIAPSQSNSPFDCKKTIPTIITIYLFGGYI